MLLAHGGAGGSLGEGLILALPLLVLGGVLFIQKTVKPVVSVGLVAAGIAVVAGGMFVSQDDHEEEAPTPHGGGSYVAAVTGLCEARRVAASDPDEALRLFQDEAHVPLHDLAAEVGERDRAAAAALLEAKQTVESEVENEPLEGDALEADLDDLLDATVSGLAAIEVEAPTC